MWSQHWPRRDAKPNLCTGRGPNSGRQCLHDFVILFRFTLKLGLLFSLGLNKPSLSGHRDLDQTWRGGGAKDLQMAFPINLWLLIWSYEAFPDASGYIPSSYERVRRDSMEPWRSTDIYSDPRFFCSLCYHMHPYATNVTTLHHHVHFALSLSRSGSRQRLSHPMTKRSS